MNTGVLSELSLLKTALSKEYREYLELAVKSSVTLNRVQQCLTIYSAYCFVAKPENYTAIDILNNNNFFNKHFQLLVGFIYSSSYISISRKYEISNSLKKVFHYISLDKKLTLDNVNLSSKSLSEDAQTCIKKYIASKKNKNNTNYIKGWRVLSKEGKVININLDMLYINFGEEFTNKVHAALSNHSLKQKTTTLSQNIKLFKKLFIGMTRVHSKEKGLTIEVLLSQNYVQSFFHKILKVNFASSQALNQCPRNFYTRWKDTIHIYTECFIDTGIFDEPIKPFIAPNWKHPKNSAPTFSFGMETISKEKEIWFTHIPLKITDFEATSIIQDRISRSLSHIKHVTLMKLNELLERESRNQSFLKTGVIKPLNKHSYNKGHYGLKNLNNTVATFYAHGIAAKQQYHSFLRTSGNSKELTKELNLPTTSTLNVLLTLLVLEHPLITPAWLQRWELFDAQGNQVGYKITGNVQIAVSYKARKGSENAQQEIILSDLAKTVVEFLIQHTRLAREHLKKNNDANWRKMLLTASINSATCLKNLNATLHAARDFYKWLQDESLFDEKGKISKVEAQIISEIHSLRSVRRHRALQIYLETRSIHAVASALGHKKTDIALLNCYLPKPLMDFFNDRWVRQFQNTILLEAMKESAYHLEIVDMTAEDINEFLCNHGISNFPDYPVHGFLEKEASYNQPNEPVKFDQITYTISTSLLQLLIAIRCIVESNSDEELSSLHIVDHWYESAVFILNTLSSERYNSNPDLMTMQRNATLHKLDLNLIKKCLLC